VERTIYNGVLSGVSLDGTSFFYVNALQRRTDRAPAKPGSGERQPWYACACCPPNLMRIVSSWPQYQATVDTGGVQLHQYATAEIHAPLADGTARLAVDTAYPWDGSVRVTVLESPPQPWTLSMRVPGWCRSAVVRAPGREPASLPAGSRHALETRTWAAGDTFVLDLDMPARTTVPDHHIDAVRGCIAVERGPLVYCLETVDLPGDVTLEEVELEPGARPVPEPRPDVAESAIGIAVPAVRRRRGRAPRTPASDPSEAMPIEIRAVPYFTWANRSVDAMRVWIPVRPPGGESSEDASD
jgi:DUF1680 family protein